MFRSPLFTCSVTILWLSLFFHCDDSNEEKFPDVDIDAIIASNMDKITISTGVTGTLKLVTGNCMPIIEDEENQKSCAGVPVKREILVYELTTWEQLTGYPVLYDSVESTFITKVKTDNYGFYEIPLEQGTYSIFIMDDGKYYARLGKDGFVNPVSITVDSVSILHPVLDYAVY